MINNTPTLPPLVSVEWLYDHLNHPKLIILDASLRSPTNKLSAQPDLLPIKNALRFDIDAVFSDTTSSLPHMIPSENVFTNEAQQLGINHDSVLVVYDHAGVYSSPRAWWMFRAMGHRHVAVLNGGLPAWTQAGFPCDFAHQTIRTQGNFVANYQSILICNQQEVLAALADPEQVVIDARPKERFLGKINEPRPGLRRGHMPNAVNLPFNSVQRNGKMLAKSELEQVYQPIANTKQRLIFSCGSGVTACIVALGAALVGFTNLSVYDGSWSEWGLPSELPVEQ